MVDESMAISLEDKAKLILEDRKNSNYLVDLLAVLESSKEEHILEAISCLKNVFKVFILRQEWHEVFRPGSDDDEDEVKPGENLKDDNSENTVNRAGGDSKKDAEKIFAEWLHEKYLLFLKTLLRFFAHVNKDVAKASLECLMQFLKAEHKAKSSSPNHDANKSYFPNMLFGRITSALVTAEYADKNNLLRKFETYCGYLDIQFYTLKNLKSFLNNKLDKEDSTNNNICSLLLKITAAGKDAHEIENKLFILSQAPDKQKFSWESKKKRNLFGDVWLSFLQTQLPQESLKKVLLNLHEGIMPLMENPKLLIDFLTDAYDMEGPLALLALNGLFILIQQYNLAYPDFFKKLYRLLDSKVFNLNYRSRFFTLTDLFLTSVNLPSYMVAAFAKRLARLSLTASPDGIIIILALIENLMKRHPSCRVLIHRKTSIKDPSSNKQADPYDHTEEDPSKCNAINSSMWELKTLEQHYLPDIQEAIKIFQKPFSKEEKDIGEVVDVSYGDFFGKDLVAFKADEKVPLAFKPQDVLFDNAAFDRETWSIE